MNHATDALSNLTNMQSFSRHEADFEKQLNHILMLIMIKVELWGLEEHSAKQIKLEIVKDEDITINKSSISAIFNANTPSYTC